MALKSMAQIAVRPRRAWLIATLAPALLATAGCSHHRRDSLRPVYGMPATAAPCTNCGSAAGSSTIVTEPPAGATPRACRLNRRSTCRPPHRNLRFRRSAHRLAQPGPHSAPHYRNGHPRRSSAMNPIST